MITEIETVTIEPTKYMPLHIFRFCHRMAFYMELMAHLSPGLVLWDDQLKHHYDEVLAESEWYAIQNEWFSIPMELPKMQVERLKLVENLNAKILE